MFTGNSVTSAGMVRLFKFVQLFNKFIPIEEVPSPIEIVVKEGHALKIDLLDNKSLSEYTCRKDSHSKNAAAPTKTGWEENI